MSTSESLIVFTCFAILSEIVYNVSIRFYKTLKNKPSSNTLTYSLIKCYNQTTSRNVFNKVIFFPDPGFSCHRALSGRQCKAKNCVAIHETTSLSVLLNVLKFTKSHLDVCVYMITCSVLGRALLECHERGIAVRVITEERNSGEEGEVSGAQIGKLRAAGINVRCKSSSFWMHHKFMVADNEVLVNGSFNWTNQAVVGNSENILITSEKELVQPFILEFEKLWDALAPPSDLFVNSV